MACKDLDWIYDLQHTTFIQSCIYSLNSIQRVKLLRQEQRKTKFMLKKKNSRPESSNEWAMAKWLLKYQTRLMVDQK